MSQAKTQKPIGHQPSFRYEGSRHHPLPARVSGRGRGPTRRKKSALAGPVLPAEADASRLPPGYVGHNGAAIFTALMERRAQFHKGQFETTPEYESRVERIVSSIPAASARLTFLLRDAEVTYDADASSFKISIETQSPFPDTTYVAGDWSSPYGRFSSIDLLRKSL